MSKQFRNEIIYFSGNKRLILWRHYCLKEDAEQAKKEYEKKAKCFVTLSEIPQKYTPSEIIAQVDGDIKNQRIPRIKTRVAKRKQVFRYCRLFAVVIFFLRRKYRRMILNHHLQRINDLKRNVLSRFVKRSIITSKISKISKRKKSSEMSNRSTIQVKNKKNFKH